MLEKESLNEFNGEQYPLNYVFYSWVLGLEDALEDGDVVGYTEPIDFINHPNRSQQLVWDQGTVISRTKK